MTEQERALYNHINIANQNVREAYLKLISPADKLREQGWDCRVLTGSLHFQYKLQSKHYFRFQVRRDSLVFNIREPAFDPRFYPALHSATGFPTRDQFLETGTGWQINKKNRLEKIIRSSEDAALVLKDIFPNYKPSVQEVASEPAIDLPPMQQVSTTPEIPLNQIFYGPPGTGKTYRLIDEALRILDPDFLESDREDEAASVEAKRSRRERLQIRFNEFRDDDRVMFTTFHQSFSYEDFVEGLRAVSDDETKQLSYPVKPGAFMRLCKAAESNSVAHVLIIDEINRGNVSRIFGELITLIEASKRKGNPEALEVTLPYSGDKFSVPQNVYLIGTMNTTDKSLTGLDVALRRRFSFTEMPPKPELLDGINIEGINVGELLQKMNERIEVLLDRDHCLGHAYFLPLQSKPTLPELARIFKNQILPLLQEYFFEDWERIGWVLNDLKYPNSRLVSSPNQEKLQSLFGSNADGRLKNNVWSINESVFQTPVAYRQIISESTQ